MLPLAAFLVARARVDRVRSRLGLHGPRTRDAVVWALVAACALAALAAAQPAIRSSADRDVRADVEALYVVDVSRSMLASREPGAAQRIERARDAAMLIARDLDDVSAGVASITDRVLPHLFPTADDAAFEQTLRATALVGNPPPQDRAVNATSLAALADVARANLFSPEAARRLVVVLTDGESRDFSPAEVGEALRTARIELVVVRFWDERERVYGADGVPEALYRPDAASAAAVSALAAAAGGAAFDEGAIAEAAAVARDRVGQGPTEPRGTRTETTPLAPLAAVAALLPLALVLRRRNVP